MAWPLTNHRWSPKSPTSCIYVPDRGLLFGASDQSWYLDRIAFYLLNTTLPPVKYPICAPCNLARTTPCYPSPTRPMVLQLTRVTITCSGLSWFSSGCDKNQAWEGWREKGRRRGNKASVALYALLLNPSKQKKTKYIQFCLSVCDMLLLLKSSWWAVIFYIEWQLRWYGPGWKTGFKNAIQKITSYLAMLYERL